MTLPKKKTYRLSIKHSLIGQHLTTGNSSRSVRKRILQETDTRYRFLNYIYPFVADDFKRLKMVHKSPRSLGLDSRWIIYSSACHVSAVSARLWERECVCVYKYTCGLLFCFVLFFNEKVMNRSSCSENRVVDYFCKLFELCAFTSRETLHLVLRWSWMCIYRWWRHPTRQLRLIHLVCASPINFAFFFLFSSASLLHSNRHHLKLLNQHCFKHNHNRKDLESFRG